MMFDILWQKSKLDSISLPILRFFLTCSSYCGDLSSCFLLPSLFICQDHPPFTEGVCWCSIYHTADPQPAAGGELPEASSSLDGYSWPTDYSWPTKVQYPFLYNFRILSFINCEKGYSNTVLWRSRCKIHCFVEAPSLSENVVLAGFLSSYLFV